MNYRYHPIVEGLKVNEDGTEILLNNQPLKIYTVKIKTNIKTTRQLKVNGKSVTAIKLVCEAWHGAAPTGEHAARRVDESKGDHYSNLYWGKKGTPENCLKLGSTNQPNKKMVIELYATILDEAEETSIKAVLKEKNISERVFYRFQKKYVTKKESR